MPSSLSDSTKSFIVISNFPIFWLPTISKSKSPTLDSPSLSMKTSILTLGSEPPWQWLLKFYSKNSTIKNAISGAWESSSMKCYLARILFFCTPNKIKGEWASKNSKASSKKKFASLLPFPTQPKTWSKKCLFEIQPRDARSNNSLTTLGSMTRTKTTWIKFYLSRLWKWNWAKTCLRIQKAYKKTRL